MFRLSALAAALLLTAIGLSLDAAPAPPEKDNATPLPAMLFKPIKFEALTDPGLSLTQALESLSKKHDIAFFINDRAFGDEQVQSVGDFKIAEKPFPGSDKTRLDTVLHQLLARLPVPSGATYLVRRDGIEITTVTAAKAQIWGANPEGPFLPMVHIAFEKRPLEEALKELAEQAEYNIVLDPRAGDKSKTPMTARFLNTPLDSAAHFLADSADLQPVILDNVIYVTTKENAARLEVRFKRNRVDENTGMPTTPRIGGGVRNRPSAPPAGGM